MIFREGDPSDYFYLITSGRVRRITNRPPERFQRYVSVEQELSTGDYFGTSAILGTGDRRRHSTMVAVTDVSVVRLGRDDFEAGQTLGEGRMFSGDARTASHGASSSSSSSGKRRSSSEPLSEQPPQTQRGRALSGGEYAEHIRASTSGSKPPPTLSGSVHRDPNHTAASSLLPPRSKTANSAGRSAMRSLRFIKMMSNHEQRKYGKGDTLFREGEDAHEMFIITSGLVQVALQGKDGKVQTVGQRAWRVLWRDVVPCVKPRNSTLLSEEAVRSSACHARVPRVGSRSWDVAQDILALSDRHSKEKERRKNFSRTRMRRAAMRMRTMHRERCAR